MRKDYKSGAVSLFVVVFTALLVTTITVGFISLMVRNQKQATDSDLSQSAYDSALVGVEDAKRAILRYFNVCPGGAECTTEIAASMVDASQTCTNVVDGLTGVELSDGEVKVQTGIDNGLNQAYTCVKVSLDTPNYLGSMDKDTSKLIPLVGVSEFEKVKIDWYMQKDLSSGSTAAIPTASIANTGLLIDSVDWVNIPSVMRTQLIQYSASASGFKLSDFDNNIAAESNTNTLFLYPTNIIDTDLSYYDDNRRNNPDILKQVHCMSDFSIGGYACTATIVLPTPINGGDRVAYLNLASLYSKANFQITLLDAAGDTVNFNNVQPEIDSTGRANDVFRRVKSRVEMSSSTNLVPFAAVDVEDSFCKNYKFFVDSPPDPQTCG